MTTHPERLSFADWARLPGLWSGRVEGQRFGTEVTVLFVALDQPGSGPKLHVHPYDELFIIRRGRARYTIGDEVIEAGEGDILFGPAEVPHRFEVLEAPFESTDIHLSERWIQIDLE
ncbi:cupin domain-containing protein [Salipiger marinus]|jgi:mannose-6-phosphate isomerase-like protein (cupin superfamily)|uniref:Cupin domain-containing protein n=1 Tax=Salipiger marinus TaxID=555512 RepID=A0A1G8T8M6_9RHOB|nr:MULTISPECIES: cupin domain-containing protein [Salipiger]HBM61012.1 cupin domain-containing protein [Citreicella sp.]MCD1616898.1 cupin domain-containing protein [Salipiger manganoxidans]MEB3419995.1 cupin domain-containing protein [Salipiger manganoxidans]SDJ37926.1 Cupin domain-containing protein [Salipiger marinus]HBT03101.1 cupin domain-containing protein [Citreicella sp.]